MCITPGWKAATEDPTSHRSGADHLPSGGPVNNSALPYCNNE